MPGFETLALVERLGANAATVTVWPREHLDTVLGVAARAGIVLSDAGEGQRRVGLFFQPDDFGDDALGELADGLTRCGVGAFAYSLRHADLDATHVDVFVRAGRAWPLVAGGCVFVRSLPFRDEYTRADRLAISIFGAPPDLDTALAALQLKRGLEPAWDEQGLLASLSLDQLDLADVPALLLRAGLAVDLRQASRRPEES